jgi:cell division protein FtsQ
LLGLALMAVFGKRGGGSGVLEAPEDDRAQTEWTTPEPAPAGMLHRARVGDAVEYDAPQSAEEVYKPKRGSWRYKLRLGVPKSIAGKIIGGTLLFFVVCVVCGVVFGMRLLLLHDPRFTIASSSEIEVQGNTHLTRDDVLGVFGADIERNIFKVPLTERQADLERLPWVKRATVMRLLPDVLRVSVTERTPVAFVREANQIGLVDADGVLLDMPQDAAGNPNYSFPVLTGISGDDPLSARAMRVAVYQKFMKALDSGTAAGGTKPSASISEVDVSNPDDVKALLANGSTDILVHFGHEDYLKRYNTLEQNLPGWKTQYPNLASVDTRYDNQFVLEMKTASGSAGQPVSGLANAAAPPAAAAPVQAAAKPAVTHRKTVVRAKKVSKREAISRRRMEAMLAAARRRPVAHGKKP